MANRVKNLVGCVDDTAALSSHSGLQSTKCLKNKCVKVHVIFCCLDVSQQ